MKLTMLGSGTSSGVPRIGGDWGDCDPANPRNRRRRVSILVESADTRLLVDTGPDLREQLLDANVGWITAVLYTHDHADHCHGIDDLRALFHAARREIDCYMDRETRAGLRSRFAYVFAGRAGYPPTAKAHLIEGDLQIGSIRVRAFRQQHGPVHSLGFRFEAEGRAIAYSTDVSALPEAAWPLLANLDLWVVDALRRQPHPTHSHLAQTLEWIDRAKPHEAWLTHMDQSMDHDSLAAELPPGITPGYDGRIWEGRA
ncbi:MBL fold metallo-hydrolase [Sandaracinobacteroides hominis]|uniref:MBL fold metallo-hydrolase n=1 Tax=Sandaracinobacteroides hominis TaxID=2780086 RepID=UPI0018F6BC18|nr:MBL fold metallo-hydrolase [Sandaracinobacteroides hominis]